MSNMKECMDKFRHYCMARIPFVSFETIEVSRALEVIRTVTEELGLPGVYVHSVSKGTYEISTEREVDEDRTLAGAMTFMGDLLGDSNNLRKV